MPTQVSETILIFAANLLDESALTLDREFREIQNGLRHSRKHFNARGEWTLRPADLRRALLDHRPSYVHFCGNGAGAPGIVLEGRLADADALASLFALFAEHIKCVVLNSCFSSVQAHAIAQHIDYVVGMSKGVGEAASIEFSTAFYDGLGAGESIESAFKLGRATIQLEGIPDHLTPQLLTRFPTPHSEFLIKSLLHFADRSKEGILVRAVAVPWFEIMAMLRQDPEAVYKIPARTWEEIIAGAYERAGFDEVILTPRSGDKGRDIVATKSGIGSIRIFDQVKAYSAKRVVSADEVRAMLGVITGAQNVSKAVITTTSHFAPRVESDEYLSPYIPYRLELKARDRLLPWLDELSRTPKV